MIWEHVSHGTVQTIGHKKIRLPAPCRACSKIGSVFFHFHDDFSRGTRYFTNISPTSYVRGSALNWCTCNFAKQSSSEWPSLPAPARGGWNDVQESSNKTTAACRFLVTIQAELDHLGLFQTNIDVSDSKILIASMGAVAL